MLLKNNRVVIICKVSNTAGAGYCVVGPSVKANRARILLNCGPVSSVRSLHTSCPEHLVRYLLAQFTHILQGGLLYCFYCFCIFLACDAHASAVLGVEILSVCPSIHPCHMYCARAEHWAPRSRLF